MRRICKISDLGDYNFERNPKGTIEKPKQSNMEENIGDTETEDLSHAALDNDSKGILQNYTTYCASICH